MDRKTGSIHRNTGSIHTNTGSIHRNTGSIHRNAGPIHLEAVYLGPSRPARRRPCSIHIPVSLFGCLAVSLSYCCCIPHSLSQLFSHCLSLGFYLSGCVSVPLFGCLAVSPSHCLAVWPLWFMRTSTGWSTVSRAGNWHHNSSI